MDIGDTVFLKSGSPPMTVDEINGKVITTKWFNGAEAKRGDFPEAGLTVDDPRPAIMKASQVEQAKVFPSA